MTPAEALAYLCRMGLTLRPEEVKVETRGEAFALWLPGDRLAWFAPDERVAARLAVEDRVLTLIASRCGFRVPSVCVDSGPRLTLRSLVPGAVDFEGLAARLKADPALIARTGMTLGAILAEQHGRIAAADAAAWLPDTPNWPWPRAVLTPRLRVVVDDVTLRRRIDRALDAYDDFVAGPQDRVLVHTDLGLHNIAWDPATGAINGVFDYRDAAWADRHFDFRYFVFGAVPDALLDAVMEAYTTATGVALCRQTILLCNAAVAISHLAFRSDQDPEASVGGRTLAGDLGWTQWALKRAGL